MNLIRQMNGIVDNKKKKNKWEPRRQGKRETKQESIIGSEGKNYYTHIK